MNKIILLFIISSICLFADITQIPTVPVSGGTCTNQFTRTITSLGAPTCASVAIGDVTGSTGTGSFVFSASPAFTGTVSGGGLSSVLLAKVTGANMNVTTDQAISIPAAFTKYTIQRIVVTNASISLTTAVGGFYTAAAKGGTAIIANTQIYTALSASSKFLNLTLATILTTDVRTEATLYFALTTAQGAAATADIYIFGDVLP